MKKLQIVGLLASVVYEEIKASTVMGDTANKVNAGHIHTIGYKCPARVQLDTSASVKIKKGQSLIHIPSADAIKHNITVKFLPMSKEDRKQLNVEVVICVDGQLTNETGKRLNVIPNKFDLGAVVIV